MSSRAVRGHRFRLRRPVRSWYWVVLALAILEPVAAIAQQRQHDVLVLYAVRRDAQLAIVADREIPRVLQAGLAEGVDYYSEFMDRARLAHADYESAFRAFLALKYSQHRFDAVVAMGDEPLDFLRRHRDSLFGDTPIVFFSTRSSPDRLVNSTGVIAELDLTGTLELAARLQPDLRRVFVVNSESGSRIEQTARLQFQRFASRFDFEFLSGLTARDLEARLGTLPSRSAVYYLVVDRDANDENVHPLDYVDQVTAAASAPVYSWVDSALSHGIVGGSLKDQTRQAAEVGKVTLRVLRGEPAESIAVARFNLHAPAVDWRQLRRWNMNEGRLPPGTAVHFREPSAWERYRAYILAVLALLLGQTVLIAALLMQRLRRERAEAMVVEGEAALRASYARIRDLGGRLLQAQDSERARVARELHDDVSQQLALLEIDLELLGRTANRPDLTSEVLDRARSVARSVHDLSHRLHPAKLRLIGLAAALKGLQRELSHEGVAITFNDDGLPPAVPPDVTVSIFRVAQEALQNALKHSGARTIVMHLRGTAEHVALSVADDGAGFEAGTASGQGLGLISMQERIEGVGGHFDLRSSPGNGTRVAVIVPIRAESA